MSYHSRRNHFQQDVICTALGCNADVNERYLPATMCQYHAEAVHRIVEANREFIREMHHSVAPREGTPLMPYPKEHVVYYIQFPHGIKIGTTTNLRRRLQQFCLPDSAVLAIEPGDRKIEHSRHEFFKDTRILNTEVFEDSPKLRKHIEAVIKYHGEPKISSGADKLSTGG